MIHHIEFDSVTESKLSSLAVHQGKAVEQLIQEVIRDYLEEREDAKHADAAYQRYLHGREGTISLDELEQQLGLES